MKSLTEKLYYTSAIANGAFVFAPSVVAHSSGVAILSGSGGYIAGTIGLLATSVAALPLIGFTALGVAAALSFKETFGSKK